MWETDIHPSEYGAEYGARPPVMGGVPMEPAEVAPVEGYTPRGTPSRRMAREQARQAYGEYGPQA